MICSNIHLYEEASNKIIQIFIKNGYTVDEIQAAQTPTDSIEQNCKIVYYKLPYIAEKEQQCKRVIASQYCGTYCG